MRISKRQFAAVGLALAGSLLAEMPACARQTPDAKTIWRKSIQQGGKAPFRARMALTLWKQGKTTATVADVVQDGSGRYSIRYDAPAEARGRLVSFDGSIHWQYEPKRNLVIKTPLNRAPKQEIEEETGLVERNYRMALISDHAMETGRPAYLLELKPIHTGGGSLRYWIDRQTFRKVRIEARYADGSLARRLAYEQMKFPSTIPLTEFQPTFDKQVRIVSAQNTVRPAPADDHAQQARSLGLKTEGRPGFRLSQVTVRNKGRVPVTQFLYTDGIETVSVFVRASGHTRLPIKQAGWSQVTLGKVTAYHQRRDHTDALVWASNGRHYTAVSHLAPEALQAFVSDQIQ